MFRVVKGAALLAVVAFLLLLAALWIEHQTPVTLPSPTGPYRVGRMIFDWADAPSKRELLVWIWYPAEVTQGATVDAYLPAFQQKAQQPGSTILNLLTRNVAKVRDHTFRGASVSHRGAPFPVAIFRAGGSSSVVNYSTLVEDLASHGYIVVGFDAPYRTSRVVFPDGRVFDRTPANNPELVGGPALLRLGNRLLAEWHDDTAFVLDRLQQRSASGAFGGMLDMNRIGVFGHSFGGATALEFCATDSRCKAGIDIDGAPIGSVIQTGVHKPFMFVFSSQGDFSTDPEVRQIKSDIQSIYDRLPSDQRLMVMIPGGSHFTFSDDGALLKSHLLRGVLRVFGKLRIDPRKQLAETARCVRTFFDANLKRSA